MKPAIERALVNRFWPKKVRTLRTSRIQRIASVHKELNERLATCGESGWYHEGLNDPRPYGMQLYGDEGFLLNSQLKKNDLYNIHERSLEWAAY